MGDDLRDGYFNNIEQLLLDYKLNQVLRNFPITKLEEYKYEIVFRWYEMKIEINLESYEQAKILLTAWKDMVGQDWIEKLSVSQNLNLQSLILGLECSELNTLSNEDKEKIAIMSNQVSNHLPENFCLQKNLEDMIFQYNIQSFNGFVSLPTNPFRILNVKSIEKKLFLLKAIAKHSTKNIIKTYDMGTIEELSNIMWRYVRLYDSAYRTSWANLNAFTFFLPIDELSKSDIKKALNVGAFGKELVCLPNERLEAWGNLLRNVIEPWTIKDLLNLQMAVVLLSQEDLKNIDKDLLALAAPHILYHLRYLQDNFMDVCTNWLSQENFDSEYFQAHIRWLYHFLFDILMTNSEVHSRQKRQNDESELNYSDLEIEIAIKNVQKKWDGYFSKDMLTDDQIQRGERVFKRFNELIARLQRRVLNLPPTITNDQAREILYNRSAKGHLSRKDREILIRRSNQLKVRFIKEMGRILNTDFFFFTTANRDGLLRDFQFDDNSYVSSTEEIETTTTTTMYEKQSSNAFSTVTENENWNIEYIEGSSSTEKNHIRDENRKLERNLFFDNVHVTTTENEDTTTIDVVNETWEYFKTTAIGILSTIPTTYEVTEVPVPIGDVYFTYDLINEEEEQFLHPQLMKLIDLAPETLSVLVNNSFLDKFEPFQVLGILSSLGKVAGYEDDRVLDVIWSKIKLTSITSNALTNLDILRMGNVLSKMTEAEFQLLINFDRVLGENWKFESLELIAKKSNSANKQKLLKLTLPLLNCSSNSDMKHAQMMFFAMRDVLCEFQSEAIQHVIQSCKHVYENIILTKFDDNCLESLLS